MPQFMSRIRLCEMFGIPVYLDLSLIVLLFMFALNGGIQSGLVCAALLLASITKVAPQKTFCEILFIPTPSLCTDTL